MLVLIVVGILESIDPISFNMNRIVYSNQIYKNNLQMSLWFG